MIVLQAGTNNLPGSGPADATKVNEVVTSIKDIVAVLQHHAPEAVIVLTGVFPRSQNMALKEAIDKINHQLLQLADGKKIRFLNINEKLAESDGKLLEGMSKDGLHLEEPGYEVWAAALKPIFIEVMGPPAEQDLAPLPTGNPAAAK